MKGNSALLASALLACITAAAINLPSHAMIPSLVPMHSTPKAAKAAKKETMKFVKKVSKKIKLRIAINGVIAPPVLTVPEAPDPTRVVTSTAVAEDVERQVKYVALTFDDGPSPEYTPQVLQILRENDVHATFCLIGLQVKKYPELVRQIVAEGHKVADHSLNHCEFLSRCTEKKMKEEIVGDKELIESTVPGTTVEYYRAPGGDWSRKVRETAFEAGMKPLGWSVDTKDWQCPGEKQILKTVKAQLHPGGIILMHDAGGDRKQSVAALKTLIPQLKEEGYEFAFPG